MRIGFVVPRCWPTNSHGRYVIELARRLARTEDVVVYSGSLWPGLRGQIQFRYLPVLDWPMLARLTTAWTASVPLNLRRDFDVLHVQGADAPISNVVTAHCCTAAMHAASGRLNFRRRVTHALGARAEAYSFGKASTRAVIAVSEKVKRELAEHYHIDGGRVTVVSQGVDLNAFTPDNVGRWRDDVRRTLGLSPEDFVVLFVGGSYRLKGLMTLVHAVRQLPAHVKIVAVGITADRQLSDEIGSELTGRVLMAGTAANIAPYYAAADAFALPTLYDTFSLATLEAMASGLPVIVSRAAGITEGLTDGVDALLLDKRPTVDELIVKLRAIVDDDGLRRRVGAAGRRTAEAYSWDEVAARTLQVYRGASAA